MRIVRPRVVLRNVLERTGHLIEDRDVDRC